MATTTFTWSIDRISTFTPPAVPLNTPLPWVQE
jgi:hypothetical protein